MCAIGLAMTCMTAGPPSALAQAPRIIVDPSTIDLGLVGLGTDPVATFIVRNEGDGPVELSVQPVPQGLRLSGAAPGTLAPRTTAAVNLVLDTPRAGTKESWTVQVTTTDPATPTVDLVVRARVRAFIAVTPPASRITFVQFGREGGTSHVIAADGDPGFEVRTVASPHSWLRASFREATDAERVEAYGGRQWVASVVIARDAPIGPIGAPITIETNHPRQPTALLPVSGFVRPVIAVTPPTLALRGLRAVEADTPLASLVVKNFAEEALSITAVTSSIAGVTARLVTVEAGRTWRVEVVQTPALTAGAFSGTVTLHTDHADVRDVTVRVSGELVLAP